MHADLHAEATAAAAACSSTAARRVRCRRQLHLAQHQPHVRRVLPRHAQRRLVRRAAAAAAAAGAALVVAPALEHAQVGHEHGEAVPRRERAQHLLQPRQLRARGRLGHGPAALRDGRGKDAVDHQQAQRGVEVVVRAAARIERHVQRLELLDERHEAAGDAAHAEPALEQLVALVLWPPLPKQLMQPARTEAVGRVHVHDRPRRARLRRARREAQRRLAAAWRARQLEHLAGLQPASQQRVERPDPSRKQRVLIEVGGVQLTRGCGCACRASERQLHRQLPELAVVETALARQQLQVGGHQPLERRRARDEAAQALVVERVVREGAQGVDQAHDC